jgi:hypothetical protein
VPCRIEIAWLIEFNEKYGPRGLVILGNAMDYEGNKVVQPYVQNQHFDVNGHSETVNYQILVGRDKVAERSGGILGMPTSTLYSRGAKTVKTIVGLIDHDLVGSKHSSCLCPTHEPHFWRRFMINQVREILPLIIIIAFP